MNLTSPKDIKELLRQNGLAPLKQFGQNFLCDQNIVDKIANSVDYAQSGFVLEIGAGLGALTAALCARAETVVAVEIDKGMIALHPTTLAGIPNLTVLEGDILKTGLSEICQTYFGGAPFHVCGNLPYYITSKILLHILESGAPVRSVTAMVQKEVAGRLASGAGDTEYGALTASARYFADPELLFPVSRNCFYPAPDVDSAVIRLDLSRGPLPAPREAYVKTVRAAFAMRRKTIFNNLKKIAKIELVNFALESAGVPPTARAQDVPPQTFAKLASLLF